ncbi:MAG: DUF3465 domain-containing protein [Burkholderiaceae bacterium]|nr:DUF3465 domain-containing protein [Burkholderiaceae bacterium]
MKKILLAIVVAAAFFVGLGRNIGLQNLAGSPAVTTETASTATTRTPESAPSAFDEKQSGTQVTGEGVVSKLLADDTDGSRHQRFILMLSSGQSVLVAHNIDLAPRIEALKSGDAVAFNGVYEWNAKGGVVHWTHRDPNGHHEAGWLRHAGQTYQ